MYRTWKRLARSGLAAAARVLVVAALGIPVHASAWWNADWAYRKEVRLDGAETPQLGGMVQQVTLPIRLHAGNFPFADAQEAGADLRFVAGDDKTPLNFHIEQFDGLDELAIIWVQVPSVGGKDSSIWVYYGNPDAPAAGSAKASYDPLTVAALHFSEKDGPPRDATGFGNTVLASSGTPGANGAVGFGLALTTDQSVRLGAAPSLSTPPGAGWTLSLWTKAAQAQANGTLLVREEAGRKLVFGLDSGRPYLLVQDPAQPQGGGRIMAPAPIDGASWHHLAFVLGDRAALYVDGAEVAGGTLRLPEFRGDVLIGAAQPGSGLAAEIDEVQIANRMRAPEWIRASAISQDPMGKLAQYGSDESGGGGDYVAVLQTLANAVSTDGWVIIGLIAVMGFVSAEVVLVKERLLGRMGRENDEFLAGFREAGSPLARMQPDAVVSGAQAWHDSPLFHLYQTAANELHAVRQAGIVGELNPQAIEVLRSGIDAGIVAEAHRMNDRLVWLTLSVSGAPFLGLLGTVVGIMITFGTIAMAGDVNVNTIAPGVAAALATTVAGLIVAIPVMFAYNHLTTRIKELVSGMEVFANELLGKLALQSALAASSAAPAGGAAATA